MQCEAVLRVWTYYRFSGGRFTSKQTHWNTEIQKWLITCDAHRHKTRFNFVDEKSALTERKCFAMIRWTVEDVMAVAEERGIKLTEERAFAWWHRNENRFRDILTEYGNEVLAGVDFADEGRWN